MTGLNRTMHGVAAALALALVGAGCAGSDGAQGPQGPKGDQGDPGDQGPPGVVATATTEACRGCHGQFAGNHALAEYDAVHVTMDPTAPVTVSGGNVVMRFNVKVNGQNRDDFVWKAAFSPTRVHVEDIWWVYDVTSTAGQRKKLDDPAAPDRTYWWSFVGTGNGNYVVTIDPTLLGTLALGGGGVQHPEDPGSGFMVSIKNSAGSVATAVGFIGARGGDVVGDQACVNCHGDHVWRNAVEASGADHYQVLRPQGVTPCLFCHNRADGANDPRMSGIGVGLMSYVHGIHNSEALPGGGYRPYWSPNYLATISIGFPAYMNNCATCHFGSDGFGADRLAKVTSVEMSWDLCSSCHGTAKIGAAPSSHAAFNKTTCGSFTPCDCTGCHGSLTVNDFHDGLETERAGLIWNGADQSVVQGARFALTITNVTFDPGSPGTIGVSWTASLDGTLVDPCNTDTTTGPVFHLAAADARTGEQASNFSILKAYGQGNDWVNGISGVSSPGQPTSVNLSAANTSCSGTTATTRVRADDLTATSTFAAVSLQGKPQLRYAPAEGTTNAVIQVRARSPVKEFNPTGGAVTTRRQIVSIDKCNACHLGSMYQHGGNRVDSVALCVTCHNPASTEQQVRAGMGVTAATAYDGKAGQTYDLRTLVHALHISGETGTPIVIYRSRGVYVFGPTVPATWPVAGANGAVWCTDAEGARVLYAPVYGSSNSGTSFTADGNGNCVAGAASTTGTWLPHNWIPVEYPRAINACDACHANDANGRSTAASLPDPKQAVAVTVDMGGTTASNQLDDVLRGPIGATCTSCHQYGSAETKFFINKHTYDNGWWPTTFPNGRQTLLDAVP